MPVICLSEASFQFPPLHQSDDEGLLVIGGSVSPERILEAYTKGIFPWYNDDALPMWWSPDPRFVLFPAEIHISRSMRKLMKKNSFDFRLNTAFEQVVDNCATMPRHGQDGTWITPDIKAAYLTLHQRGSAHSAEAWQGEQLAGGVYGILIGQVFFGESMFSKVTNASKFAFINLVEHLHQTGIQLIDCQVYTTHVESLGAREIPREVFATLLNQHCH